MTKAGTKSLKIDTYGFEPGRELARKYEVVQRIGEGWEGEVYLVRELATKIERAAKFFFPQRNPGNRTLTYHAKKLHKLRRCPILIQYHTQETITFRRFPVTFLVSEYVQGELLTRFLARQPGKRLQPFEGLHLLHELVRGVEEIHAQREYHGDLHTANVIVSRRGLGFDVKVVDLFRWDSPRKENRQDDVCDLVRILYDVLGGAKCYSRHPKVVKEICCGLKRSLILGKYPTAGRLRRALENLDWE
jgi:serine/threonine protein kinase